MSWLRQQWNDIKGNFKFFLLTVVGAWVMNAATALTRGLTVWQQVSLAICFSFLFAWAIIATFWRNRPKEREARESEDAATDAEILSNAPSMLIESIKDALNQNQITFINDGSEDAADRFNLRSLTVSRTYRIGQNYALSPVPPKNRQTVNVSFEADGKGLNDFVHQVTREGFRVTAELYYKGAVHGFFRDFTLERGAGNAVVWQPGPIRRHEQ